MPINWTQIPAQMFGTALIIPVSTVVTFLVMRYFPRFWESTVEKGAKSFWDALKNDRQINIGGKGKDNGNGKNGKTD